jgi:hypothetical protein
MIKRKTKENLDRIKELVPNCFSYSDLCREIGWKLTGWNIRTMQDCVELLGCDCTHFDGGKGRRSEESYEKKICPM